MADHAEGVRTNRDADEGDARGAASSIPATRLQAVAQRLNDAPRVAALKRGAEQLNTGRSSGVVQRRVFATFTPSGVVDATSQPARVTSDATIQRFELRQVVENRADIADLHYRYDAAIGGNAQPGEHLHITVQYQPAAAPAGAGAAPAGAQTRHCYHNYNTGAWRWDNAPPAAVSAVVNLHQGPAIAWAAAHRPAPAAAAPAPAVPAGGFALTDDSLFPKLGR